MTEQLHFHFSLSCIGEGNGNPLQCSCLENPWDGGSWWAAVHVVTQSQTRLKWLSRSSSNTVLCIICFFGLLGKTPNVKLCCFGCFLANYCIDYVTKNWKFPLILHSCVFLRIRVILEIQKQCLMCRRLTFVK